MNVNFKSKTLAKNISFTGIGIHSGRKAKIKILPVKPNTGILFKRTDIKDNNLILITST